MKHYRQLHVSQGFIVARCSACSCLKNVPSKVLWCFDLNSTNIALLRGVTDDDLLYRTTDSCIEKFCLNNYRCLKVLLRIPSVPYACVSVYNEYPWKIFGKSV